MYILSNQKPAVSSGVATPSAGTKSGSDGVYFKPCNHKCLNKSWYPELGRSCSFICRAILFSESLWVVVVVVVGCCCCGLLLLWVVVVVVVVCGSFLKSALTVVDMNAVSMGLL